MRASQLLGDDDKKRIERALAAAEAKTAGEVIVCLATRSGDYDRGEDLFGVALGLVLVTAAWLLFQGVELDSGGWAQGASVSLGLVVILALFLGGFSAGAAVASRVPVLGLFFTRRGAMRRDVGAAALAAFHRFGTARTRDATGVIVYVSILERMVSVVGDDAISAKLDQGAWDSLRDTVVSAFGRKQPVDGLVAGVERAGEILAEHFPPRDDDENEISDEVRIID